VYKHTTQTNRYEQQKVKNNNGHQNYNTNGIIQRGTGNKGIDEIEIHNKCIQVTIQFEF
jgi:hypothetical protein